jgi:aminoglycoside phosphotransferase family enzyme/predicted kinase
MIDIVQLLRPAAYGHPVESVRLIETHISWVLLTGAYAYKIKKPVDFGFLDFSTLDKRRECCEQELRLNRRLAPALYLDVVAIVQRDAQMVFASGVTDETEAIEYAVRMRQFPQSAQLDNMLHQGGLTPAQMDVIADMVARFHSEVAVAGRDTRWGSPTQVYVPVEENFRQIRQRSGAGNHRELLDELESWSRSNFTRLQTVFEQRKQHGFVRECHGDMHLRNMLWLDGQPLAFDCIEFNPGLRWIDVLSEVAFLVMDLRDREQPALAQRFLNHYLECTGDYAGLPVLPFYLVYRAMVRAKVDAIRAAQQDVDATEKAAAEREHLSYLRLAQAYTKQADVRLIITRGMSASGKSTVSQQLMSFPGYIRIRSDVERKRMFDIDRHAHAGDGIEAGIYSQDATRATYARLAELAAAVIKAGYSVIIDAAFLQPWQRRLFRQLATDSGVPYIILDVFASADSLRRRIKQRSGDVSDADLRVLEHQLARTAPLDDGERDHVVPVDTETALDINNLYRIISNWK